MTYVYYVSEQHDLRCSLQCLHTSSRMILIIIIITVIPAALTYINQKKKKMCCFRKRIQLERGNAPVIISMHCGVLLRAILLIFSSRFIKPSIRANIRFKNSIIQARLPIFGSYSKKPVERWFELKILKFCTILITAYQLQALILYIKSMITTGVLKKNFCYAYNSRKNYKG